MIKITNKELNLKLIETFPEIKKQYDEEIDWQEGDETGAHVVYGDVLKPYLLQSIQERHDKTMKKILGFLEGLLKINDKSINEVVAFSVLEGIITNEDIEIEFVESMLGELSKKVWDELKDYFEI